MKKFRPLTKWAILAAKGEASLAASARWFMGTEHSVLGGYSIAQCERMDRRIHRMMNQPRIGN